MRIVGWDEDVGSLLELAFAAGLAFGVVSVVLLAAVTLTILARRGS